MTAFDKDVASINAAKNINLSIALSKAAKASGRNPLSITLDYLKLRNKSGKLKFYEYLLYNLYDEKRWAALEREEFVSAYRHWPLVNCCNDSKWWAMTEDKWLSACFLEQNGLPIPKTLAVYDKSIRTYGETLKLSSAEGLQSFLAAQTYPIFAKPIEGVWSAGALRFSGCTETHIVVDQNGSKTHEELADTIIGENPYIFQACLTPHDFFSGLTDAIATVRCLNVIDENELSVPYTVLKLPCGGNIADNFWRSGNLLCNINPETGEITGIVSVKDGLRITLDALPESERTFIGETLPHWGELRKLNAKVALLHAKHRFSSTDIALTTNGPVIVEVNNGCAFELIQIATGKGLLDQRMVAFFRKHGAKV